MHSITSLFEESHNNSVPKKYRKRITKKCDAFRGFEESLPNLSFPVEGTQKFEKDLDEVRHCVRNPMLGEKFLEKSHNKSEDIFKKYLSDEDIDWTSLNKMLDEFDGVVTRLKFKYDRPRPHVYFEERGEDLEVKESESPAFPSGHAAFAYLMCDYLSNLIPHRQRDLEKIAELICQSRLENGVHFPSDIAAGRFVGEEAAKHLLSSDNIVEENFDMKRNQKYFVSFLRERAQDIKPTFKSEDALRLFVNDMSILVSETLKLSLDECYTASKNFISGYQLDECTSNKEIKNFFKGMCFAFIQSNESTKSIIALNKILEENSTVRDYEKSTIMGRKYSPIEKIQEYLSKIDRFSEKPFVRMAVFNWLSPFQRGNEKITNILLLKETGFNFDITNQMLTDEIGTLLEDFYEANDMEMLLS